MFNIMLDELPAEWGGYPIDTDFRIGIQISQCMLDDSLTNREKMIVGRSLLFVDEAPTDVNEVSEAIKWFLNGWNGPVGSSSTKKSGGNAKRKAESMDFDFDQWRIYSAFLQQYRMDLNMAEMHFWVFMGLLANLQECTFTNVVGIREREMTPKMSTEEKNHLQKLKSIFRIRKYEEESESAEEALERQQSIDLFNQLRAKK